MNQDQPPRPLPKFSPGAAHMETPRLRPVRGFRAQAGGQDALGLSDARQVSDRVVFTTPAAQVILPHLDGKKNLDQIVQAIGRGLTRPDLEGLIAQLDDAGLLFGPTFDAMLTKMRADFDSSKTLPPASTAAMADMLAEQQIQATPGASVSEEEKMAIGAKRLREMFDQWIAAALKDVANPSLDSLPSAVVAPHIDYPRGWLNYASVWGRLRVADRPDRVIILGTNHFGESTGVCACDKGYESPLGVCPVDEELLTPPPQEPGPAAVRKSSSPAAMTMSESTPSSCKSPGSSTARAPTTTASSAKSSAS